MRTVTSELPRIFAVQSAPRATCTHQSRSHERAQPEQHEKPEKLNPQAWTETATVHSVWSRVLEDKD